MVARNAIVLFLNDVFRIELDGKTEKNIPNYEFALFRVESNLEPFPTVNRLIKFQIITRTITLLKLRLLPNSCIKNARLKSLTNVASRV